MDKILITGSSGTIGTRLFERLLSEGYDIIGFDKKKNKWHKHLQGLTILGDLLSKKDIGKIPKDIDLIVHLAANARVYDLIIKPDLALENAVSTYNILEFSRKNKIEKIIFASSREVYGNRYKAVARESEVDLNLAESPYAASKISNEAFIYSYSKCYGMQFAVLRFSNVYGMYDESDRFIPKMIKKMRKNEDVQIFGKDKVLDFTYIEDCVSGIISCIKKFQKAKNSVFNIASGKGEKLTDVARIIKQEMKSKSKIRIMSERKGEVVKFIADITLSKKVLNYAPKTPFSYGIKSAIKWYNNRIF